ncbi:MAG: ferrous iron transporter B [Clostridia bacterium]|nr:ferrous iron transporter B [Clostridia bacterium]
MNLKHIFCLKANGAFPTLTAIIGMFFLGGAFGFKQSVLSALCLTGVILLGVAAAFAASLFLSKTFLRGEPSTFMIELPPFRKPQIGKTILRSILDRTIFVLGRAVSVAAPAGILIFLLGNTSVGDTSALLAVSRFLDPFAKIFGLDGAILLAFILGFPANEIVVPIIIMIYTASGTITEPSSLSALHSLLLQNGWTYVTALCVTVFCLFHWPCSTTLWTVKKETGSAKYTLLAALLPTALGFAMCFLINALLK